MFLRYLFVFVLTSFHLSVNAQSVKEEVLFTIDDDPVYISEFLRVYNKNLDLVKDESQKDVDQYLKLFKNYKLKLKEAKTLGLHKKTSYVRELSTYKKQLASSYMRDSKVSEALVEEAYERISHDVKASHILIKISETASPKDTLIAYNKILKLREQALSRGFEEVSKAVHNGQSVFGEDLGYFSGFRMVYKFEDVAFSTSIGDISEPFRTRFGYHIIHVTDKRKSRGERTVSHIMIVEKKDDSLAEKPEVRIQDIYKKIQQGETFEALAKQFSEDKSSAAKGGLLKPFSSGQISSIEFEDVAFGLENIEDVSKPFKTKFGWHIVKLIDKKLIQPFEVIKPELEEKVKRDDRSKLIDEALFNSLKARYNINKLQPALNYFTSILNDDYFKRTWKLPEDFKAKKPLLKIDKKQLSYKDFGDYLITTQRTTTKGTFESIVAKKYEAFINKNLVRYHEDNLEHENKEFAHVLNEYRDGLLLFDLMETTIWNASKTDTVAIKNYYTAHKNNYMLPERIDAVVASSTKQKTLKKVSKLLEQNIALDQIKSLVNSNDNIEVIFTAGVMDANHQAIPKGFSFIQGISKIQKHNDAFVIVQVKEVLAETQRTFEEAKGLVISDYQEYKEENWLNTLSEKYKIVINNAVLSKVKSQIKNQ